MTNEAGGAEPLACPSCARKYPLTERFCADCGMPLVYVGSQEERPITEEHERARKVKPQYVGGELIKAAWAHNQAEAELIQGILLEEGIPSVQRRTRGFDVPDFLAAGPRDILVPQAAHDAAMELLADQRIEPGSGVAVPHRRGDTSPARLAAGILIAVAGAFAIVWLLYQLAT
ncbi:MAG TPA: hypothetical protein VHJ54_01265 [Solirubrobacterales bacterium]|nr:hypothetical protein [Solirubrobacterales bacterium]